MPHTAPQFLDVKNTRVAYHHYAGSGDVGVMFLGGFMSDMQGGKATMLDSFCQQNTIPFTRMDYGGHGQSEGHFEDGTIGLWCNHALTVFDAIASPKMVLVGSSMGGWMMVLLALLRPDRVAGLVGIASAPDFTENLIWNQFSAGQKRQMTETGRVMLPNCMPGENDYPITQELISEGRNHLVLNDTIAITCPVRLLHGMKDADVPWQLSVELAQKIAQDDVEITLIKNGDHRLSTPDNLALICNTVAQMVERVR